VEEAAAVPRPNPVLGEDVHLVVALRPDAEATDVELIEHLRSGLADYKVPRSVSFVDALPRTAMGRVARAELKAMVAEQTTAASRGGPAGSSPPARRVQTPRGCHRIWESGH
jgi:acyl-coenzyme A synthetase/AMP-(fatty) acid ligase